MKFELTSPCADCPFRSDRPFFLPRAKEILNALLREDATFTCHKTNDYGSSGKTIETENSQHCAGALIFLEQKNKPNQMMRIAERIGLYDHTKLSKKIPVYKSVSDMVLGCSAPSKKRKKTARKSRNN